MPPLATAATSIREIFNSFLFFPSPLQRTDIQADAFFWHKIFCNFFLGRKKKRNSFFMTFIWACFWHTLLLQPYVDDHTHAVSLISWAQSGFEKKWVRQQIGVTHTHTAKCISFICEPRAAEYRRLGRRGLISNFPSRVPNILKRVK